MGYSICQLCVQTEICITFRRELSIQNETVKTQKQYNQLGQHGTGSKN